MWIFCPGALAFHFRANKLHCAGLNYNKLNRIEKD